MAALQITGWPVRHYAVERFLTFAYNLTANAQTTQKLDVTINEADGDVEIILPNTFQ